MIQFLVLLLAFALLAAGGYAFIALFSTLRDYDEDLWEWEDDDDLL